MDRITVGIIFGVAFGLIDVLIMLPLKFDDRRKRLEALSGAFIDRFMLGFIIPNIDFGIHPAITGGLLGLVLSLPSAIITRVYAPIIGIGIVGGIIIGFITGML